MNEDLDLGHQDDEPGMLKGDLYRIGKYAMELYQMMDDLEGKGEVDFPHWWQSKIVKAKDMVVGAKHYLDFELKEPQIDAMVDVAAEEDVIDEAVGGKPSQEELYKVAGRPVTLIKGKKADGTDWKVKFQNGKETPLSDVLSLIKPFPKLDKESVDENLTFGGKPSQEEVDKFFEETFQETHYLTSKPVEEWDEYDMSNWKAKLKKKKQGKPQFGENLTARIMKTLKETKSKKNR